MIPTSMLSPMIGPAAMAVALAAAAIDAQQRRIPNWLTFGAWLVALPLQMAMHGVGEGLLVWGCGWLTGLAIFLPFYLLRGMAAGDVKLMAAVGAWLGASMALEIALATFVIGGLWALAITLRQKRMAQLGRNLQSILRTSGEVSREGGASKPGADASWSVGSLPYGVAIAAGTIAVLFASA
ncbi:A24 family peptidase [Ralstonia soli]|uniref:Prepilin peptidase n=1 Tax=Ralstonia soli TaxID=2953896 RepID=A0ABT1AJE1_9RALS|nr:prepilin peptidase [Ralstonia soli]MCO5398533.1 prepilin peptidase [Ralstonia soli]